jgi:hypothetical protein
VVRQQHAQVLDIDVAISVKIAVGPSRTAGYAAVGEQRRQVGEIHVAVAVCAARARIEYFS